MTLYQVHFSFPTWADDREFYAGIDSQLFLHEEDAEQYRRDVMDGKVTVSCFPPNGSSVFSVEVCESYTPSTNTPGAAYACDECYPPVPDEGWEPNYEMEEYDTPFATWEEEIEWVSKSAEFPKVTRGEMEGLLKYTKWKYTPWYEESAYYTLEDIMQDIQEVASRLEWGEAYSNIGDQGEHLIHNGVLDGGMVGEHVVECKFEFEGMLFCISTEANGVVVGFYPANTGNSAPFADEVWCIFYSDEDNPRRQRIKKARS